MDGRGRWQSTTGGYRVGEGSSRGPIRDDLIPESDYIGKVAGKYITILSDDHDDGRGRWQSTSGGYRVGEGSSRRPIRDDLIPESDYIGKVAGKYTTTLSDDHDDGRGRWRSRRYPRLERWTDDDNFLESSYKPVYSTTLSGGKTKLIERQPKIILDDVIAKYISTKVERIVDPDGESSCLCSGCRLPIFSTPSISFSHGTDNLFMHEQCARLPPQLRRHELHPHHTLLLKNHLTHPPPPNSAPTTCTSCNEICGTLFYQCPNPKCHFRLDLLCVLQIKIMHRSHRHTLTAIRQKDSNVLTCSACDTRHEFSLSSSAKVTLSYLCNFCGFWIHPDCALLPNAIVHYKDHDHSLFLAYNLSVSDHHSKCLICSQVFPKTTSGVYFCLKCPDCLAHFKCARNTPSTFKPVFIRDAKVSDLARLPLANENTSLIPYLRQGDDDCFEKNLHPHPLILNKIDDGQLLEEFPRVCNACVQSVSSPPFYSCSKCPDFILHSCCAHLPAEIKHPIHNHSLSLSPKAPDSDISAGSFSCKGCHLRCNGFAYSCTICNDFSLDVVCALINPAITHESHKNTHILFMSPNIQFGRDEKCNGCSSTLAGICYKCSICPNFKLHARCALLPNTVRHHYDQHPLLLTTTAPTKSEALDDDNDDDGDGDDDDDDNMLCEVCEEHIKKELWYYSCSECDQLFHVDCIPTVDRLSKIKLGSSIGIDCHGCPVALVRQNDAVCGGRRCGICGDKCCDDADLAYECSKCFYWMHQNCAEKYLVKRWGVGRIRQVFKICPLQFEDC